MEELKQKIENWYIENDVPFENSICENTENGPRVLKCIYFPQRGIFLLHVRRVGNLYEGKIIRPTVGKVSISIPLFNQTEENIFQLLSILKNHIS